MLIVRNLRAARSVVTSKQRREQRNVIVGRLIVVNREIRERVAEVNALESRLVDIESGEQLLSSES